MGQSSLAVAWPALLTRRASRQPCPRTAPVHRRPSKFVIQSRCVSENPSAQCQGAGTLYVLTHDHLCVFPAGCGTLPPNDIPQGVTWPAACIGLPFLSKCAGQCPAGQYGSPTIQCLGNGYSDTTLEGRCSVTPGKRPRYHQQGYGCQQQHVLCTSLQLPETASLRLPETACTWQGLY